MTKTIENILINISLLVNDASIPWKEKRDLVLKINEEGGFSATDGLGEFLSWFEEGESAP